MFSNEARKDRELTFEKETRLEENFVCFSLRDLVRLEHVYTEQKKTGD